MKILFFLPIILFFGFFAILIIAFLGFVLKIVFKSKADSWTGTVVDRIYNEKEKMDDNGIEKFYSLKIKTDDGREFGWAVTASEYKSYKPGDHLQKLKGKLKAEKI